MVRLFEGLLHNKLYAIKAAVMSLIFWAVNFAYQYYSFSAGDVNFSIVRSAAFTGTILIGLSLLVGPLARVFPRLNFVFHRRTFGVLGFTYAIVHILAVEAYLLNFTLPTDYGTNPYTNPMIFGFLAFLIFIPIYLTSTDWAAQKLTQRRWKAIHRLVYIAFIFTVLHYIIINPAALETLPGYALLAVTAMVFIFELAAFNKHTYGRGGKGRYIGIAIILFDIILLYLAYSIQHSGYVLFFVVAVILGPVLIYVMNRLGRKKQPAPPAQEQKSS